MDLATRLAEARLVPVLTIARVEDAVPLARALVAGGLDMLEVTLRSAAALDAIRAIAEAVPAATVGAGTLTRAEDFAAVAQAGARFAVSPGFTAALAEAAQDYPALPHLPAVATASELMTALAAGYDCLKFFPAEAAGGIAALKALAGPFPEVRFCPTGGINAKTAGAYLALKNVVAVGGSWVAPAAAVAAADWPRITALAREARKI
jgi:2-dehydro-3-deoxyphosphogluconate aldolase / (4S)-4-hydroxy-2-oxoglutarate aldolase